jgi:hypothetical protein
MPKVSWLREPASREIARMRELGSKMAALGREYSRRDNRDTFGSSRLSGSGDSSSSRPPPGDGGILEPTDNRPRR